MADVHDTGYLSIGEVLGLLLEEFPDVTISKIRFLESQGLISPERTPSGYRKFYEADVELLRVILTEQRQNYLPLRVIKDRLETGEIDPTGEHLRPSPNGDEPHGEDSPAVDHAEGVPDRHDDGDPTPTEVPAASIAAHPAARHGAQNGRAAAEAPPVDAAPVTEPDPADAPDAPAQMLPGVLLDRDEFCGMVGVTGAELEQLESFGIVQPRITSGAPVYDEDSVAIAKPAIEFLRAGIDARHLRNWRTSAEREASLYEQIVTPRFRQRNPEARAEALQQLRRLDALGASLRSALTRQALRHHFDG
jgi:DNA-binding transcriptional MerR regulator